MKDKDKMQRSIDEFTEWQDNQYNPGHWIGGITPNNLLTPRKPKILGAFLILIALSSLISFIFVLLDYLDESVNLILIEHLYYIAQLILFGGLTLLLFVGGVRKLLKKSR